MKESFRITCIQMKPVRFCSEQNILLMQDLIAQAMNTYPDTELIVFPELSVSGYECGSRFLELAEDENGRSVHIIGNAAKQFRIHIVYGLPFREENGIIRNSQLLIGPDGKIIGRYNKIHLFDKEKQCFVPGNEFKVYSTSLGKIGLFICYDAFFPECARILALNGAELLINSTNWESPYDADMCRMMSARASENVCYLACCNRVGTDDKLSFFGLSAIYDPTGSAIASSPQNKPSICSAVIYDSVQKNHRNGYYSMLSERRPELYSDIILTNTSV